MSRATEFQRQAATWMGCEPSVIDEVGVTVVGHTTRAENRATAGYLIGKHFVISCDPAVELKLAAASLGMEPTFEGWQELAASLQGEFLGAARMQLLAAPDLLERAVLTDGYTFATLRSDEPKGRALVTKLIEVSSAEDLDEAEIDLDDLDEVMDVVLDSKGEIAAYASARSFALADDCGDIGVLAHADHRRKGLGEAAVTALCLRLQSEGIEPLYRCDEENSGSMALSATMGFEPVARLRAYRFEA